MPPQMFVGVDPALLATLLERYRLTARECEYIVLVCRCPEPTVAEMAEHMDLRPKAVETHRAKVYDKLGVGSTIEVLGKAVQFGLVRCVCQRGKEQ